MKREGKEDYRKEEERKEWIKKKDVKNKRESDDVE